jgi:hypothetical protein
MRKQYKNTSILLLCVCLFAEHTSAVDLFGNVNFVSAGKWENLSLTGSEILEIIFPKLKKIEIERFFYFVYIQEGDQLQEGDQIVSIGENNEIEELAKNPNPEQLFHIYEKLSSQGLSKEEIRSLAKKKIEELAKNLNPEQLFHIYKKLSSQGLSKEEILKCNINNLLKTSANGLVVKAVETLQKQMRKDENEIKKHQEIQEQEAQQWRRKDENEIKKHQEIQEQKLKHNVLYLMKFVLVPFLDAISENQKSDIFDRLLILNPDIKLALSYIIRSNVNQKDEEAVEAYSALIEMKQWGNRKIIETEKAIKFSEELLNRLKDRGELQPWEKHMFAGEGLRTREQQIEDTENFNRLLKKDLCFKKDILSDLEALG